MEGHEASLTTVADGVHAWVQPDGSWWVNNAGVIETGDGVILVDTCATEARTRSLLAAVDSVSRGGPILAAINTHAHGDHTYGNSLLPQETMIIAHEHTRTGMSQDTLLDDCPPIWSPMPDWGSVTRRLPVLTTGDALTLHHGGVRVEARHPGYPAHTAGDLVVWLPDQRVLFTGDLLFHQVTPLTLSGVLDGALRALDWIAQFEPARVVPGHGPVIDAGDLPGVLETHRRYYEFVRTNADKGRAEGLPPLAVARRVPLGEFAGLPDAERFVLNLHRAYADRTGLEIDIERAWGDAIALNGGPMVTHV
ncbi:MBL fold metallo-hydrolase (plasmid) [Streptomyces sp. HUAS 31]|uniref:MBL fold metallo-hydrolase n=1 Tax=Streptomyces TaxID=1883 RepID=UPI002304E07A|nr:MBL fold metallo-hydrolase [Streptomyces sp. HUAS 31]WCE02461.1 MBL fold metallo-hydrolase [Streptomyces sp. HUAS 31]